MRFPSWLWPAVVLSLFIAPVTGWSNVVLFAPEQGADENLEASAVTARGASLLAASGLSGQLRGGAPSVGVLSLSVDGDAGEAARRLARTPGVAWAEPSLPLVFFGGEGWDNLSHLQWALENDGSAVTARELTDVGSRPDQAFPVTLESGVDVGAREAWQVTSGDGGLVVAVMDTGIYESHIDLADRLWINEGETPWNGVDDDGNGYIDDYYGWNGEDGNCYVDDLAGHGSHCAGIIAAERNGYGTVGIAHGVKLMALKGFSTEAMAINTEYLLAQKARGVNVRAVNMSFGTGAPYSRAVRASLKALHEGGVLVFAASGNDSIDLDAYPFTYPACLPYPNVLSVSASTGADGRAFFSNFGRGAVDFFAPGLAILSTTTNTANPPNSYSERIGRRVYSWQILHGTSMASPLAAGIGALALSAHPDADWRDVRALLEQAQASPEGLEGLSRLGRIDAAKAVSLPLPEGPSLFGTSAVLPAAGEAVTLYGRNLGTEGTLRLVDGGGTVREVTARRWTPTEVECLLPDDPGDAPQELVCLTDGGEARLEIRAGRLGTVRSVDTHLETSGDQEIGVYPSTDRPVVLGDVLYGIGTSDIFSRWGYWVQGSKLLRFDPSARRYEKAPLDAAAQELVGNDGSIDLDYAVPAAWKGAIYLFGGSDDGVVYRYDPDEGSLTAAGELPRELKEGVLQGTSVADGGGCLYLAGGSFRDGEGTRQISNRLYRFDPPSGEWLRLADLPTARYRPATLFVDGKLLLAGGVDLDRANPDGGRELDIVDVATGTSETVLLPFPTLRGTLFESGRRLYFFGATATLYSVSVNSPLVAWTEAERPQGPWRIAPFRFAFEGAFSGWSYGDEAGLHLLSQGWDADADAGIQLYSVAVPEADPGRSSSGCSIGLGNLALLPLALILLMRR